MTVKNSVLIALEHKRGRYLSGEDLATTLGVSRAAVGKAVKILREEGYTIDAVTNKGYLMPVNDKALTAESVRCMLPANLRGNKLFVYEKIDSTNLQAKKLLLEHSPAANAKPGLSITHGSIIIANQQTAGRGRLGRSFFSPKDGLYMSIIIRPNFDISKSGLVTVAAAAATSEAIDEICEVSTQIKWVNDIYLDDKKICGILTEATTDFESGQIDSLIIGIGINTSSAEFPAKLKHYADSISNLNAKAKSRLAATVVSKILHNIDQLADGSHSFLDSYRTRCMLIDRNILVFKGKYREDPTVELGGQAARALSIDDDGGLNVMYEDGKCETLKTGEVSIRYK